MAKNNSAYPDSVDRMINEFSSLPGIGRRSAERLAFHILKASKEDALALARVIEEVKNDVGHCSICWNLADNDPCQLCNDPRRDRTRVLIVEQPRDLIALEQTGMYRAIDLIDKFTDRIGRTIAWLTPGMVVLVVVIVFCATHSSLAPLPCRSLLCT